MGLTLYVEQKLEAAELDKFFDGNRGDWLVAARKSFEYVKNSFPSDAMIRRDDVAQFLLHVVEVDEGFKNHLAANRLKQKYWAEYFADLVIDRTWNEISQNEAANEKAK